MVIIEPLEIVLAPGQSSRFKVRALDQFDNQIDEVATLWRADDGGLISSEGTFRAPTKAGNYPDAVGVEVTHGERTVRAAASVVVIAGPLAQVTLHPPSLDLNIGDFQQFAVKAVDEYENDIQDLSVEWRSTSDAGAIDGNGGFVADTKAGIFTEAVSVIAIQGEVVLQAIASVIIKPNPLDHIEISPAKVFLDIGAMQSFSVKAFDQYQNEIQDIDLTWNTAIGNVNGNGRFIASTKAGTFANAVLATASHNSITKAATATVTIYPDPLNHIELLPEMIVLDIDETQVFSARAFDRYRNQIEDFAPVWNTKVGSIGPDGSFNTGTKAGTFDGGVTVEGNFKGVTRKATAAVTIMPGPLASLALTPERIQLEPQRELQLEVIGIDAYDNLIESLNISWASNAIAGKVNASGKFISGTKAGTYRQAITIQGEYRGVTRQASTDAVITPGSIALIDVIPSSTTLFTGDQISLNVEATDRFGNLVTPTATEWRSDAGSIEGNLNSATFWAGREPGDVLLTAQVADGRASAQGGAVVQVDQGYCESERRKTTWNATWWSLNDDATRMERLGTSKLPGTFDINWERGAVFGDRTDRIELEATTQIVVRRQGLVFFNIGGDDGYRLLINGEEFLADWEKHPFRESAGFKTLEPGIYQLVMNYYEWTGNATLKFFTDPDVLEWEQIKECFGGYAQPSDTRFAVYQSDESLDRVADQFGISPPSIVSSIITDRKTLLVPGKPRSPTKVILIQGIDSEASCDDRINESGQVSLDSRTTSISRAIQTDMWSRTGDVSALDARDVLTFSYADTYEDCSDGMFYRASELPKTEGFYAVYGSTDTCAGVEEATEKLRRLIERIVQLEPETQFDLVGHSMGGMIAAYLVATLPEDSQRHVRSVVTLDSPLLGETREPLSSSCSFGNTSWQDIKGRTDVVDSLASIQDSEILAKILSINATDIGDVLDNTESTFVDCADDSAFSGGFLGGLLGLLGFLINPIAGLIGTFTGIGVGAEVGELLGHSCVWYDTAALESLADFINRAS